MGQIYKGWIDGYLIAQYWELLPADLFSTVRKEKRLQSYEQQGKPCTVETVQECLRALYKLEDVIRVFPIEAIPHSVYRAVILQYLPSELQAKYRQRGEKNNTLPEQDPVVNAANRYLSQNPDATLEDVANSDEVNRCFNSGHMPAISTIMKRLQGKVRVKKGRRKCK